MSPSISGIAQVPDFPSRDADLVTLKSAT